MLKRIIVIAFVLIFGSAIIVGLVFWNQVSLPVASSTDKVFFTIAKGQGVKDIAAALRKQNLIRSPLWFEVYTFLDGSKSGLMDGSYYLQQNMNTREVVKVLTGDTKAPEQSITIIEGLTIVDMAKYLGAKGVVAEDDFLIAAQATDSRTIVPGKTYDFLADKPAAADLEGYLFPDTYRVLENPTAGQVIEKMLDNFGSKFTSQMRTAAAEGHMSMYQIVTLASILEKEIPIVRDKSGNPINNDLSVAAGVFYNRLNTGMALQSDATLVYATGKKASQLTAGDKKIDSPYNTYKYPGLPFGPICNPSIDSISAAIYPAKTDYLYFLTTPDGSVVFSKTYEEHLANIKKYL
jgi:UPF0755 protein